MSRAPNPRMPPHLSARPAGLIEQPGSLPPIGLLQSYLTEHHARGGVAAASVQGLRQGAHGLRRLAALHHEAGDLAVPGQRRD